MENIAKESVLQSKRVRTAVHNNVSENDIFSKLAKDDCSSVRFKVAQNPDTPKKILEQLFQTGEYLILVGLAKNTSTPKYILEKLAGKNDKRINKALAGNPKTPGSSLEKIVDTNWLTEEDLEIKFLVLANPNTPQNTLKKWGGDFRCNGRFAAAVASNPSISKKFLFTILDMSYDKNIRPEIGTVVDTAAILNPIFPEEEIKRYSEVYDKNIYYALATCKKTPKDILEKLVKTTYNWVLDESTAATVIWNWKIWQKVAENVNAPMETLEKLVNDPERWVIRYGLTLNPIAQTDILSKIFKYKNKQSKYPEMNITRTNAISHPNFTLIETLVRWSKHKDEYDRAAVAKNPNISESLFSKFIEDKSKVKIGLTFNCKIPLELLNILSEDNNHEVRKYVAQNLHVKNS